MTTTAAAIMALHREAMTTREIALAVYGEATDTRMAYVRIVVNQRKGGSRSPTDDRYWANGGSAQANKRQRERYAQDAAFRQRYLAVRAMRRKKALAESRMQA